MHHFRVFLKLKPAESIAITMTAHISFGPAMGVSAKLSLTGSPGLAGSIYR
jgi:hypothetical protein